MEKKQKRSVKFEKPVYFSEQVLVGNWVEERSSYKKQNLLHRSIYSDEYIQKPFDTSISNCIWDQKLISEGHNFVPPKTTNETCSYFENYSSTYDLSYTFFPNWYGSPIFRKYTCGSYQPQDEYIRSYGNLSNYGISSYKKQGWKCDIQDPRTTVTTSYEDSFLIPHKSAYTLSHWCRITPKKGNHPSLSKCNVITWECR